HRERCIAARADCALQRLPEARPAGAAVVFRLRRKQRLIAAGAMEGSVAMLIVQRAGVEPLRTLMAQHTVLLWREKSALFFIGMRDRDGFVSGSRRCLSGPWRKA